MTNPKILYLVRHGVTEANLRVVYAGRMDDELLPVGESHVQEIANYLCKKRIISIMSSPQKRAYESALPLARKLNINIERCEELAELEMGPWSGLTDVEIAQRFPSQWETWRQSPADVALPHFEGLKELEQRAIRWLDLIATCDLPQGDLAAFSHETVIKAILGVASGVGLTLYRGIIVPNASVSSLILEDAGWRVRSLNEFVSGKDW